MDGPPAVSVIVVTHNSVGWIVRALRAIVTQEYAGTVEVVVVDNGSVDGTPELVQHEFPSVVLVRAENRGFGAGNNIGARHANGSVLAFVNPDTEPEPGWLRWLVAAVGPGGRIATSCIVLDDDPSKVNTCGNIIHFTGFGFTDGLGDDRSVHGVDREVLGISGASFAIGRDDFAAVGGFDEDFFLYVEDTDLSWRARRAGLRIVYAARSVTRHAYSFEVPPRKLYHLERGRALLLRKHFRPVHWLAFFPSVVVAEALAWAWAVTKGRDGIRAKARATRDGWLRPTAHLPRLPAFRLQDASVRFIPFARLTPRRTVRALGSVVNAVFGLNTIGWGHGR